ncbi:MAG: exodeoxyribonuclease VII large subunit [Planctomycetaceae bacterium]|nr:exodeoxyribonuclease VII large subunit [Planctomycetaceae bacterium]
MSEYPLFENRADHRPLSVWELTSQIKDLLEAAFPEVWVAGEISNFVRAQSGHCYLTLKDDQAQLRAVMWRGVASRLRFEPHDGLEVVCRGNLDLYAARGTYQLVIADIVPKGMGALELALRQLREKLGREGLFDASRKRPLPAFVRHIAVVTSPTGAAIHDFLQVLGRRWRGADVLVAPVRVQGEGAAAEIAAAIATINRLSDAAREEGGPLSCGAPSGPSRQMGTVPLFRPIDCIVVTRGGGSMEDLWAFNEEPVVRAIAASRIPVVSAIGHEIDVTLSDLAADVRALTPSEAAELVAPAADEMAAELRHLERRLGAGLRRPADAARSRLDSLARHTAFRRPFQGIFDMDRRLDELDARAYRAMRNFVRLARHRVDTPRQRLESLSPLAVLERGYSITQRAADGRVVRAAAELSPGEEIITRFASGRTSSRVEGVEG